MEQLGRNREMTEQFGRLVNRWGWRMFGVWIAVTFALNSGCTRRFFRTQTDKDVVGILTQKNQFPDWGIENWHVYPDPRARFADPTNPDRPPKPQDDYATEYLSPNPQKPGKAGCGDVMGNSWLYYLENWDQFNRQKLAAQSGQEESQDIVPYVPNQPDSPAELTSYEKALRTQEKPYLLTLEQASELSLFNSRDFQDRREDLYTAALPVSFQRFSFVSQLFATEQAIREVSGRETVDGKGNRFRFNSNGTLTRLFPTGATLLLQIANRLVINLGDGKPDVGITTLSLNLTQPFLRGGGYAVTLEPLTQAERNLVYAIRSYARFRKIFYLFIATGDDQFNSPFSFAGLNLRGVGPSLNSPSQGFLPTLLLISQQRNEIDNVAKLEEYLRQFRGFAEGSDVSPLQADQVEQQLLSGRNALIQRRLNTQIAIDAFKVQLGIPQSVPIELEAKPVEPITQQLDRFNRLREDFNNVRARADNYSDFVNNQKQALGGSILAVVPIELPLRSIMRELFLNSDFVKGTKFRTTFPDRWSAWEKRTDLQIKTELSRLREVQRDLLAKKTNLEKEGGSLSTEDAEALDRLPREIYLGVFETILRQYESKPWEKTPGARGLREQATLYREVINYFTLVLTEPRDERLEAIRESWPSLPPVCVEGVDILRDDLDKTIAVASQTALANRLELMNARGQLVDAWRQIAVQANALQGVFNVGYQLDTSSPAGQNVPLGLGGSRTRNQLIVNGELPLVRRLERNNYRTAILGYQRSRRALQATEDFILNTIRNEVRSLRTLAEQFKIQQRTVDVSYALVENSLDVFQAPPDPRSVGGGQTAGNAAALTQQLLNAQSSLVRAQNDLYDIYVRYLIARMQLYRDLELLPLDSRGVWNDELSHQCDAECIGTPKSHSSTPGNTGITEFGELHNSGTLPEPKPSK